VELLTLISVLLLQVVSTVHVSEKESKIGGLLNNS
jgi:hypothetical protein